MNPALHTNNQIDEKRKHVLRILVITGASGGHIFPVLAFLDTLKEKQKNNIDILLVLPKRNITEQLGTFDYNINYLSISSIKLSLDFKNIVAIFRFFKGSLESIFIILRFKPTIVVGFGSLTCIPMVILARVFGIKTLIHEQNIIPGRANRLLTKFTDRIAISFSQTKGYFKDYQRKIVLTGNPIRRELKRCPKFEALDFFGFSDDKFTILVMGGSLGSHNINVGFLENISGLSDKRNLQIIHLAGLKDCDLLKQSYKDLDVCVRLFSFLKPMQYAYSACDLVISRAGATTIAEIIFFRLPAIIVPYPYAYQHQFNNAKILESKGCAIIIEDNQLQHTGILSEVIDELINDPAKLTMMRSHYNNFPDLNANVLLVDEVLSLYNR